METIQKQIAYVRSSPSKTLLNHALFCFVAVERRSTEERRSKIVCQLSHDVAVCDRHVFDINLNDNRLPMETQPTAGRRAMRGSNGLVDGFHPVDRGHRVTIVGIGAPSSALFLALILWWVPFTISPQNFGFCKSPTALARPRSDGSDR